MKKIKITSMFVISILVGISITAGISVSAGEIQSGRIHVTINNDVYGSTSPDFDLPDETNVTFSTTQVAGSSGDYYKVDDNLTIPLDVTCLKDKVYVRKMLRGGIVIAYRNLRDIPIVGTFSAVVQKGELIGNNLNVSENVSIKVDYELTEEQFNSGESMTMYLIACGTPFPGETEPFDWTINLDDMLGDGLIGRIIKEFTDVNLVLNLNPLILAIKQVELNVDYELVGYEQEPGLFSLNATVAEGNGTINIDPNLNEYQNGTVVNLTAKADPGFIFDHWSGDVSSTGNPVSVTMDENKTVQAHFSQAPVLIEIAPKLLNIGGVDIQLVNQESTKIVDAVVNITAKGGLLGLIDTAVNEIVNISVDTPTVLKVKTKIVAFGPIDISVKVTVGTDVVEREFSAMQIGPIVMV
jgi:hypothetical protein